MRLTSKHDEVKKAMKKNMKEDEEDDDEDDPWVQRRQRKLLPHEFGSITTLLALHRLLSRHGLRILGVLLRLLRHHHRLFVLGNAATRET